MIYAKTPGVRKAYQQDSQTLKSLMVGSLVTAGAVYIYNLVDVTAVPKKVPINQKWSGIVNYLSHLCNSRNDNGLETRIPC